MITVNSTHLPGALIEYKHIAFPEGEEGWTVLSTVSNPVSKKLWFENVIIRINGKVYTESTREFRREFRKIRTWEKLHVRSK